MNYVDYIISMVVGFAVGMCVFIGVLGTVSLVPALFIYLFVKYGTAYILYRTLSER